MVLPSNTVLNISTLVHLLNTFDAVLGYNFKCPLAVQWTVRSNYVCSVELRYTCLYDDGKENATERCNGPLTFIAKGYTWMIRGNPDRDKCSKGTYQPYKHRNLKSSDCVYKKSLCNEEGQVMHDKGNNTDDPTCRCDYRKGYDFVVKPRNKCYCYPSTQDCSCYIRQCDNKDTILSQDYQCEDTFNTTTVCNPIKEDLENEFHPELFTRFRQNDVELTWSLISITISIVCPLVVFPLVLVAIHMYPYSHRRRYSDIIFSPLQPLTCRLGDDATFECTSTGIEGSSRMPCWFKDKKKTDPFSHWQTSSHKHALVINAVSFEDEGLYTIKVKNDTSKAYLKVEDTLSINSEDIYYVLSVHAICKIAIPAVRTIFDREIKPDNLFSVIRENTDELHPLQISNAITGEQWRILNENSTPSKDLDMRLMVFLLRNIKNYKIKKQLPPETDKREVDDLCRIDYYRNIFAHYQKRMSDTEFKLCLKDIMEAAQRLTGVQHDCSAIVISTQLWNDYSCASDELTLALKAVADQNEPEEIKEMIRNIEREEMNYLRIVFLLHRIGCPAVRYKFNSICRPADLKHILEENRTKLESYIEDNKITFSQWKSLFPIGGKPSSKYFDMKLLLTLMIDLQLSPAVSEEMHALILLNEYLHTLARSNNGHLSDQVFGVDWDQICGAIIVLGGKSCGKRFKNLCCVLRPEKKKYLQTLCN